MPTHKPKEAVENRRDKYGISFRVAELDCCPQCNDNNIKKLLDAEDFQGESGSYSAYECGKCGALFCNPQVVDEDIPKLYEARNTQDFNPTVDRNSLIFRLRMFHARRQIRGFLGRIGKPTQYRAMDFGCGDGMFSLALADNLNCLSVTAVDFQNEPPPALASTPVDYASISDLASGAADGSYDVVICRHIVEHVVNPREFVRQSARYLKPGGHLFVEVPNFQSIWRRIFGQHWSILYVPRHLYWFTEQTLGQVFDGLDLVDIYRCDTPTIGGSLQLRFGLPINNTDFVGVGLYPIQAIVEKLAGESSTLVAIARRPLDGGLPE